VRLAKLEFIGATMSSEAAEDKRDVHGTATPWSASAPARWRVVGVLGLLFGQGLEQGVSHIRART